MRCFYCGMRRGSEAIGTHAWHCLNCGHVNEAITGSEETEGLLLYASSSADVSVGRWSRQERACRLTRRSQWI